MRDATLTELSSARKGLVRLMQQIGYGRIEDLAIRDSEPVLEPKPRIIREVKFGQPNVPSRERRKDFALKQQVVELFERIDEIGWGTIASIEIRGGLPLMMRFEEVEV